MKRDLDLYRKILFEAEESDPTEQVGAGDIDGYSDTVVYAHIRLLADEKLVKIVNVGSQDYPNACRIKRITAAGHDFLAETQDDDRWSRPKQKAWEIGHSSTRLIERRYGHLLKNRRTRGEEVEFRIENHQEDLGEDRINELSVAK